MRKRQVSRITWGITHVASAANKVSDARYVIPGGYSWDRTITCCPMRHDRNDGDNPRPLRGIHESDFVINVNAR